MIHFLHHNGDNDGWACRWIVHRIRSQPVNPDDKNLTHLGKRIATETVETFPVDYGYPYPAELDPEVDVIIADFSFTEDIMERIIKGSKSVLVVDHHESEIGKYQRLQQKYPDKFTLVYDKHWCGAYLLWKQCFGHEPIELIRYIDDHDLWKFSLENSRLVRCLLHTLPPDDMSVWDTMSQKTLYTGIAVEEGRAIRSYINSQIQKAIENAHHLDIPNALHSTVPVLALANSIKGLDSELGHALSDISDSKIGCTYHKMPDGRWKYSLRSQKGVAVNGIAQFNGGGGHENASGFILDNPL